MSAPTVYTQIRKLLEGHLDDQVDESSRERLVLLVMGMLHAESSAPARIAPALKELGLTQATQPDSIERRIRRVENDPELTASLCVHPVARQRLLLGRPGELVLIVDPTTQEDQLVMVSIAVWYRGRALPLVWAVWPGNTPLQGDRFWSRIAALLDTVQPLLPVGVPVTWLADRAFGTPAFTDLVTAHGWHYVVRVQGQTHCRDRQGRECACRDLIRQRGQRAKLRGLLFKKSGWRQASVVVYWGRRHRAPVCIVSDLGAHGHWLALYRRRFPIEATFRDYKSYGGHWEQGQVTDLPHVEHLLVGMALATWVALSVGTQVATALLNDPPRDTVAPSRGWASAVSLHSGCTAWANGSTLPSPFNSLGSSRSGGTQLALANLLSPCTHFRVRRMKGVSAIQILKVLYTCPPLNLRRRERLG